MEFIFVSFFIGLLMAIAWTKSSLLNLLIKIGFVCYTGWASILILQHFVPVLFVTIKG